MYDKDVNADIYYKTAAQWAADNPYLPRGDMGVETDTGLSKLGVGYRWSATPYTPSATPGANALSITKTGEWQKGSPTTTALVGVPPQSFDIDGVAYSAPGLWLSSWSHSESSPPAGARLTSLSLNNLAGTSGFLSIGPLAYMTSFSAPALKIAGGLSFSGNTALTDGTKLFPSLVAIIGANSDFGGTNGVNSGLTSIDFPELVVFGGAYSSVVLLNSGAGSCANLTSMNFPKLQFMGNAVIGAPSATGLTNLDFPSLKYLGTLTVTSGPGVTTLTLPSLVWCDGGISFSNTTNLANVTLPVDGRLKGMTGNVTFTGFKLTQASVDNIIQALALLDGTGGTTSFGSGRTLNLGGGTNAAPTVASTTTTAGSNVSCSGTTCTVTLTAHGFTTGDVIGVSGVTTATNANRWAVITVTGANTFTYTISSQTATGAGTATIRKAGADLKAIVTRGATVTTN